MANENQEVKLLREAAVRLKEECASLSLQVLESEKELVQILDEDGTPYNSLSEIYHDPNILKYLHSVTDKYSSWETLPIIVDSERRASADGMLQLHSDLNNILSLREGERNYFASLLHSENAFLDRLHVALNDDEDRRVSEAEMKTQIVRKIRALKEDNEKIKRLIGELIEAHFPEKNGTHSAYLRLRDVVGWLLEKRFVDPDDPYVDMADKIWPPHLELLKQYNVVEFASDQSGKIKLVTPDT